MRSVEGVWAIRIRAIARANDAGSRKRRRQAGNERMYLVDLVNPEEGRACFIGAVPIPFDIFSVHQKCTSNIL